jgi:anaerobic selenocysteine-containing dehydrogenase
MLTVWGVDLTQDAAVRVYHTTDSSGEVVDDLLAFLNQPDSIIVGREFAAARGLQQGDGIDLATPRGVKRFVIRGLLEPTGAARVLRGRLVVMDLYAPSGPATDGQIGQIDVLAAGATSSAPS